MTNGRAVREPTGPHGPRTAQGNSIVTRVVIADDDPETLELLIEVLRGPTIEILGAVSGAQLAVLLAEHGPFDLIVTDIEMPWMDGLAVVRAARAAEIQAPVLFISGDSRPESVAAIKRLGDSRFLRKPVVVSTLRRTVKEMLAGVP